LVAFSIDYWVGFWRGFMEGKNQMTPSQPRRLNI
jgi:hypothetical protein